MPACSLLAGMNRFLAQLEITFRCDMTLAVMRAAKLSELVTASSTMTRMLDVLWMLFPQLFSVFILVW